MSTTVEYNGFLLKNCQTERFQQEAVYDESDTDLLHHRFSIRVSTLCHADQNHAVNVATVSTPSSATNAMNMVKARLLHPRGDFFYRVGNQVLLAATPNPTSPIRDVKNGPKPKSCDIVHVVGTRVFRIEFEIEINVALCPGAPIYSPNTYGAKSNPNVLSNRWSLTEEKDEDFFTSRVWEGTLRVAHSSFWPHAMRYLVVPPLQRKYRRESQRFVQSADGLTLKYQISDRQAHAAPPTPATNWEATYTESTGLGGARGFARMDVRLRGAPDSKKQDLIVAAARVVAARLGNLQRGFSPAGVNGVDGGLLLRSAAIVEHLHKNEVSLQVEVSRTNFSTRILNTQMRRVGEPLPIDGYDPEVWPVPSLFDGSSPAGIFATYLQSPCSPVHGMTNAIALAPEETDGEEYDYDSGESYVYDAGESLSDDVDEGLSDKQKGQFPYTFAQLDNRYATERGTMQLPIARANASGASVEFIPLHSPVARRILTLHLERIGDWPEMPSLDASLTDPNGVEERLLHDEIIPFEPELMPDGKTLLYKMQGKFVYGLARALTADERLRGPSSPADQSTPETNSRSISDYSSSDLT